MNNAVIKFLFYIIATFVSISSAFGQSNPSELLQELNRGVRVGNFQTLSPDEQNQFLSLLTNARDLLNGMTSEVSYLCVHTGNNYYTLTDLSTGKSFGSGLYGLETCKASLPAPGSQFACVHTGNNYYTLMNLPMDRKFGVAMYGLDTCKMTLPQPRQILACVHTGNNYYQMTNLRTGISVGTAVYSFEACVKQLP